MELYTLEDLYTLEEFKSGITTQLSNLSALFMGVSVSNYANILNFVASSVYGYFYDDIVAYKGEDMTDVKSKFMSRISYDIGVKLPYWYRKYEYVKKVLTDAEFSLMQTSTMTSSSSDSTSSAGGSLQKGATTPTGVKSDISTTPDEINIEIDEGDSSIETNGFVDKYTNYQQKYANASRVNGERSGNVHREGSVDELLNILEKLPASFGDEITKHLQKHFIFDYDGLRKGYYNYV